MVSDTISGMTSRNAYRITVFDAGNVSQHGDTKSTTRLWSLLLPVVIQSLGPFLLDADSTACLTMPGSVRR